MTNNTVSTGQLSDVGKSNSVEGSAGGSVTVPQKPAAGSARRPQDIEDVPSDPTSEPERAVTGGNAAASTAEAMDPVNMATGEYIYEDRDFILPDMGGEYILARRYTGPSKKKPDRSLGKAWAFSTDTFVNEGEKEAVVTMPDGKTAEYIKCGGIFINKKSGTEKYMLEKTQSGYIFTDSINQIKYYYGENGKITKKADRNGNATDYIYNEYGIEKVILPTGYYITFMRENMKISSATDSTGRMVRYEYNKGLLTKVTRCDGTEIKYTYDEKENLKAVTDGMGCTYLENRYDDSHRVIWQKTADGRYCTCTYDEKNRTNTVTEEEKGAVIQYQYDKNYDITCIRYSDGSEEKRKTDKYGNITKETDRCGAVTSYKYDKKGNLLVKKEPSGLITRYEYNGSEYGSSLLAKRWDNAGRQAIYSYDPNGNVTGERRLLNDSGEESVTEYKYDSYGRMVQKNENGRITTYKYEGAFPYPTQITSPDGTETKKTYDAAGRLSEKTTGDITEKYTYTDYNKIETYTDGEGGVTEYKYDRGWRAVEIIRPGQERGEKYRYDCMDRLISEEDACGRKTVYKRNAYGDIIQVRKCGAEENAESITYEYDSCHRAIRKNVGTYGFETYEYDNCGRTIRKISAENGRQEENNRGYEYIRDIAGRITMEKDPYGNITNAYCYDLCGNVEKHIHSPAVLKVMAENGGTADDGIYPGDMYSYCRTGLMTSKKELLAITKEGKALYGISIYKYDKDGNLITEKSYAEPQDGNGEPQGKARITERKYDGCGRLEEISDSEGAKAVYEYDMHGRKIKETEVQDSEKSRITEYGYDRCGRLTSERIKEKKAQEPQHREKLERRNGNRFLEVRKTLQKETETQEKLIEETKYGYDKSGNIAKAVLPDGLTITYSYDASGRRTAVTASDAKNRETVRESIYKYDEYGYLSEKTENGITTKYENNAFGNIKKEINADGGITTYNYGLNSKCINIISPEENRKSGQSPASSTQAGTVMEYDLCGRLIKTTDPTGNTAAENAYDTSGNLIMQANADGNTIKYAYDAGGRLKYSLTAAGVRKEYTYNAYGDITAQSLGKEAVYYKTDIWGHILEIKTAEGIKETYEYDYMGNLMAAIDGEGRRREYHRDICGNTDRITYADGSMEAFAYDEAGRPASKTYRSGKIETYTYDVFGNPLKIQAEGKLAPDGMEGSGGGCGENEVYTYEYDKNGRVKSAAGGGIKYTYGYDLCGRPQLKSACGRTLIKYGYDLNGNITSVTDVTGKTTFYEYDITDRLSTISENGKILAEYAYTPCGKVSEIKCGDIKTEYKYDPDGRKAGIKVTAGINTISDIKYIYDESGNCIKKASSAGGMNAVTDYGYDGMGRLTKVNGPDINETYTYDNAGNRISRTINGETEERYSYNELNMLMSIGHTAKDGSENGIRNFTYDADGNMTSDGKGIYKYDSLNRMSEAVMEDGRKLTCRYDAEGLRHETEEDGRLVRFIYSGKDVACEEADDNITRYIRGNGRITASDSENARTYYHYACDSLGSITHVIAGNEFGNGETDGSINGRILCRYEYDAFGNAISEEETVTNRYGFAGEMHDCITDMYYLRARYYCADIGRFAQEDTYHGDGLNLYVYAGNNPVKYVDPSGHERQNGVGGVSESGSNTNGIYEKADYHGKKNNAVKNKAPNKGQEALDKSVSIGPNTTRRVGISDGEIVVFDETTSGIFHGHVRSWNELSEQMKASLRKAGMVNKKGKIIK